MNWEDVKYQSGVSCVKCHGSIEAKKNPFQVRCKDQLCGHEHTPDEIESIEKVHREGGVPDGCLFVTNGELVNGK